GFQELVKALENFTSETIHKIGLQTEISAIKIQNEARRLAPIRDGFLHGSIVVLPVGWNLVKDIVARKDYAVHQEFGTVKMKGKPFMRPAYSKEEENYRKRIAKIVEKGKL